MHAGYITDATCTTGVNRYKSTHAGQAGNGLNLSLRHFMNYSNNGYAFFDAPKNGGTTLRAYITIANKNTLKGYKERELCRIA